MDHKQVYAVDWMGEIGNRSLGQVLEWAEKEQPELFHLITDFYLPNILQNYDGSGMLKFLRTLNDPDKVKFNHEMYMAIARVGKGTEYVGIDWLRWWCQRHLTIYKNLSEMITEPSDRILLIIGAAYVYLVSQFLHDSGLFEVVPVNDNFI